MSSLYGKASETGMLMKILRATVAFGKTQKLYCSNSKELFMSVDNYAYNNFANSCAKSLAFKFS
jgi:hypothetical protein